MTLKLKYNTNNKTVKFTHNKIKFQIKSNFKVITLQDQILEQSNSVINNYMEHYRHFSYDHDDYLAGLLYPFTNHFFT